MYITRDDDISVLPMSRRSVNCLRRENIYTIGALMDYPIEKLIGIRNLGVKSFGEVCSFVQSLKDGTGDFALVKNSHSIINTHDSIHNNPEVGGCGVMFLSESGVIVNDIPIAELPLSVRAQNSLRYSGYKFASQLVGITYDKMMNIKNIGKKTAEEVIAYIEKITIRRETRGITTEDSTSDNDLAKEMCAVYGKVESTWLREILTVKGQFTDARGETLVYRLYDSVFVRGTVKSKILKLIKENGGEISKPLLKDYLPRHLNNTTIFEDILLELKATSAIEISEDMIYRQYPSISQYVVEIQNDRERGVLQARLDGKTLQEIGDQYGITKERVRQIMLQGLKKKPCLREDKYIYIYNHYNISLENFMLAFDESAKTYYYLEMICQNNHAKKKTLEEILTDTAIAPEYRKKAERAIYKRYIFTDGIYVKMDRHHLIKHYIKNNCNCLTKFDDFVSEYTLWLDVLGLGNDSSLRTYENILNGCDYVLWNQWRSFRYYNISEQDFDELISTLDLEQFENTELSTLKLFRDYPDLMQQYDIHDEYELHNLLKKIWPAENTTVKFKRMPTIEIGTADRSNQVLSLLFQYAPITADALSKHYEEEYGVKAASVKANYLQYLDHYFYQGVYSVDFAALSIIQRDRMKTILTRDFYTIQEIKQLYKREFSSSNDSLINPYTLKTLGFNVYSGYVVKNTYATAADYFRYLLTTKNTVDVRNISKSIRKIYVSELYHLRSEYKIIEFSPSQYINIRKLNAVGVTVDDLIDYQKSVAVRYAIGEYFTVTSLRQDNFTHKIDDFGFDDWFYASVLRENRELFSCQRIGGTRIFLRGRSGANLGGMLTWLLKKCGKIYFYDLTDLLKNHYGVVLTKERLRSIIDSTGLYYDSIMEAVYIDYETYFEEI